HVVKLLTAVTIVLSIPTMIASIYGMNVPLPYQDEPGAFAVLICVMVVMSVVVAMIFRKKNYF
ncbi:MAG: CorA family divalent cation transporter, partial [Wohlfahrtiimonas sp.]